MADHPLRIRPYHTGDAQHFARLNRRWIQEFFGMESEDNRVLSAPEAEILDPGGHIAIAELEGEIVGTGALQVPEPPSKWLELVKMATDPAAQGKGVGSAVLDYLIAIARERGAEAIWFETNDRFGAATRLYDRKGTKPLSKDEEHPTPYSRCNLQMVLTL